MTPALATVLVMYGAFIAVGWLASLRTRAGTAADLMVAGRQMPLWVAVMTMTATWVDGGYLLGTAEGAYASSMQLGLQGGVCFGASLVLGGLLFAALMRRHGFVTLIDPFEARYGARWAAVLSLPALAGELFWSAALLVAIGSTFGVLLGMSLTNAILLSAFVTTLYTAVGGMWSVAYTDVVQLGLVVVGLLVALPYALDDGGGLSQSWTTYAVARPDGVGLVPPLESASGMWTPASVVGWWDVSFMLLLGGIPWNCYFQRVLSCRTPGDARRHSVLAGAMTMLLTVPPLLMGLAAFAHPWPADLAARLEAAPAEALPLLLAHAVPPVIGLFGLAAIVGAVTSSFSSSILSAGSMVAWNGVKRLVWPALAPDRMARVIRVAILLLGVAATIMALRVRSVQALWFFTSDLVFVLLFPQLLWTLFDPRANRTGSMAAFSTAAVLRLGAGEPLLGVPALWSYPELWPVRIAAAAANLVLMPVVSRVTGRWDPPRPLGDPPPEVA